MYLRRLSWILISFALASCQMQTYNSVSGDPQLYATDEGLPAEFAAARSVMRSNCVRCHSDFGSYSEAEWVDTGLVVAGSPATSRLFTKLRGSNTGGEENMPPDGALSSGQIDTFRAWIESL